MSDNQLLGLNGNVALVTGAGLGVGRGCALMLARAGCDVAVVDIKKEEAAKIASEIASIGRNAVTITADVTKPEEIEAMISTTVEKLGGMDICVNNVGGQAGHRAVPLKDVSPDAYRDIVQLNLESTFFCVQKEAANMMERGVGGSIINMASVAGIRVRLGTSVYGLAKAGIINLTRNAASEYGPEGIRVNAIAPSMTATEVMSAALPAQAFEAVAAINPLRRVANVEDVGGVAVFLASQLSSYVNGQLIVVDGGDTINTARPSIN